MDASQILVAILATALAVFLILAIVLAAILIRVARQIQRVTSSAERTAATFEGIVGSVQKAVAPAVVSRFVMEQIQRFTDRQAKRDKKD
jgi:membrane protein implicated in regulation of membrane protease activity